MGMSFSRLYSMDADAEENGKWFTDILNDGSNVDVKVRRITSTHVQQVFQELMQANKQFMDEKGKLPQEKDMELMYLLVGKALLVDWKGVLDDEGAEIPFDIETAELFCEEFKDFRAQILTLSQRMDNFRAKVVADVSKN